jgi:hypothetical protein
MEAHLQRMEQIRIPLQAYKYQLFGKEDKDRPRRRWREIKQHYRPEEEILIIREVMMMMMTVDILTHGNEAWTIRKQRQQRLTTAEMKFITRNAVYYLLNPMRNEHILDEVKVSPITEHVNNCRHNLLQHVNRMDRARNPKQIFLYIPI